MDRLPDDVWSSPGFDRKYRFEQTISTSAMAIVARARHLELDECVAIKFLSPAALRSPAAVARFRREARAAAKIKSQHVVRILDVATTTTGIPYMVMEYLDGLDLERLLAQRSERKSAIPDAVDFVLQASEAVIEGHAFGIVHRDLKPANLFCVDRGDGYPLVKVLDFGISKFVVSNGDAECTDRYEILGSPRYMSPEQIDATCNVDQRTDIWSLGVILYEAIAGKTPFSADFIPELWRKIRQTTPTPLDTVRQDCPSELAEVVATCLQKDPANRYGDLGELAKALAPFAPERSRASLARIRFTAESTDHAATPPSTAAEPCVRSAATHTGQHQRWAFVGGIALAIGVALSFVVVRVGNEAALTRTDERARRSSGAVPHVTDSTISVPTTASSMEPLVLGSVASTPALVPARTQKPSSLTRKTAVLAANPSALSSATDRHASSDPPPALRSSIPMEPSGWILDPIEKRKRGAHE